MANPVNAKPRDQGAVHLRSKVYVACIQKADDGSIKDTIRGAKHIEADTWAEFAAKVEAYRQVVAGKYTCDARVTNLSFSGCNYGLAVNPGFDTI